MKGFSPAGFLIAVLQIAAVYIYFLLFDQFGILHHLHALELTAVQVQMIMAAMGVCGLASSFVTARLVRSISIRPFLVTAWILCAVVAGLSLFFQHLYVLILEGALIGLTTGAITVLVATVLLELVPRSVMGLVVGLGTGLAYAASNLPLFFDGSLGIIVGLSAGLSLLSAFMIQSFLPATTIEAPTGTAPARMPLWPWVLGLFVLVGLDCGAFAMLQQDELLKSWTWGPADHKTMLGLVHFGMAVVAGFLIDRGLRYALIGYTWVAFFIAFSVITHGLPDAYPAALLYASGISTYSVLLVVVPSLLGGSLQARAMQAAWMFGISGWLGSAFGVGMAQNHRWVPGWFLAGTGLVLLAVILAARKHLLVAGWKAYGRVAIILLGCALWLKATSSQPAYENIDQPDEALAARARGREVYRQESCINCHSQYIRPGSIDEAFWGPYSPIDRTETPPFVGNRRLGPDLKNVGLRRSAAWQRAHLINSQLMNPHSRMPSYAHLFREGVSDGDDLVTYLCTLGLNVQEEYTKGFQEWEPQATGPGSADHGAQLFQQYCTPCHGPDGKGDGPAASFFNPAPRDLTAGPYIMANPQQESDALSLLLARIIKYGLPGTSMPGHEVLPDQDIVDIVHFIASLQFASPAAP